MNERIKDRHQLELLYLLIRLISQSQDFERALIVVLQQVCYSTGWEFGEAWVPDASGEYLQQSPAWFAHNSDKGQISGDRLVELSKFRQQSAGFQFPMGEGLPGRVWANQKPLWLSDASQDASFSRAQLAQQYGLRATMGIPIICEQRVVAILVFFLGQARPEDKRSVELISSVATQLGELFRRKQIEQEIKETETKYRDIYENSICGIFQTTLDGEYLSANQALALIYGYDSPQELVAKITDIGQQLYVDPQRRQEFIHLLRDQETIKDFISPVYHRSGKVIWVSEYTRIVKDSKGNPLYYEGMVEDVTYRLEVEKELYHKAHYDALTQLPNRTLFMERLLDQVDRETRSQFALLFLDLDRFKVINDSLGHSIGDKLLVQIAQQLEQCVKSPGCVFRLGGDEFTILLENVEDIAFVETLAEEVLQWVKKPLDIEGHRVFAGTSIGIVLGSHYTQKEWHAQKKISAEMVLRDADIALRQAKNLGKDNYQFFQPAMRHRALALMTLETNLRRAINAQEFLLHYQPIIELTTGKISGFETLIRWHPPQQAIIGPEQFIGLAEDTGLIVPLGRWILRESCLQLKQWQNEYPQLSLTINVNVSLKQLTQSDFVTTVEEILAETGISPQSLKLEITESYCIDDENSVVGLLEELRTHLIQLCIDDFGTGYSSLNYLHRLPIQVLKIDRSYIQQIESNSPVAKVARMIFSLAQSLGLQTVAEGIETESQFEILREMGCHFGQGYWFSRPIPAEEIKPLLQQQVSN